jgi:hypothetical protein
MKITLSDLPDDIRKKIASENRIPRTEKSFQIYASDLSRVFDIGEIADMFVTVIEGKQVLRVIYYNKEEERFQTVKTVGKVAKKSRTTSKPTSRPRNDEVEKKPTIKDKLLAAGKDFLFNPERNKGKREMFGGKEFGAGSELSSPNDFAAKDFGRGPF